MKRKETSNIGINVKKILFLDALLVSMRGKRKLFSIFILLNMLFVINLFEANGENEVLSTLSTGVSEEFSALSTAITYLNWSEYSPYSINENYSVFSFFVEYQILNPNPDAITIHFSYTVQFKINMSFTLEDKNLIAYEEPWGAFCMITEKTLQPGFTYGTSSTNIIIREKNQTKLPDGIYVFWVQDYCSGLDSSFIFYNQTILKLNSNESIIDYGTTTYTLNSGISVGQMCTFGVLILAIIVTKRKRKFSIQ